MIIVCVRVAGCLFATAFCLLPEISAQEQPLIRLLQIEGTCRPIELETRAGQPLDLARIERDVRHLWATGWFEDVSVESMERSDGAEVKFILVESSRLYLREVRFEPPGERRPVALAPGARIDKVVAAQVSGELRRQLEREGFANAMVRAEIVPAGFRKADLLLRVEPGRAVRVGEVRFEGSAGLDPGELRKALRATRARRILPGLGPLWGGWKRHPAFTERVLQEDADRLRSLYFSQGYFDAYVKPEFAPTAHNKVGITFHVNPGPRYRTERVEVVGHSSDVFPVGAFETSRVRDLCRCLFRARRESERRGELGFTARLEVVSAARAAEETSELGPAAEIPPVMLRAQIRTGGVHRVGRIEFRGHRSFRDATLRRALAIEEGDLYDPARVQRSLARLSRIAGVERVEMSDVLVRADSRDNLVDLTIPIKERPRGRWALSGPLGPLNALGPMQFMISSRLPGVGGGPLELSTYYASFSLLAYASPWTGIFATARSLQWLPLLSLQRPYLPGQEWQSGFLVSPQLGGRGTAAAYALTQGNERLRSLLRLDEPSQVELNVPVSWRNTARGDALPIASSVLRCEPERSGWARLARASTWIAELAAAWMLTAKSI
jgi:hypothetical protein